MKLKAKKSIKKYKTRTRTVGTGKEKKVIKDKTSAWLDAVYRANKEFIDERLPETGASKKSTFKRVVYEYIDEGMTPSQALSAVNKSTIFTPVAERMAQNAISGIKDDPEVYKQFREATKVNGRYTKIDLSNFKWDKNQKAYTYGDLVISFRNSPYEVRITNKYVFS